MKLLQFHENHRPPYFGTFTKSSTKLSFKNPFKKDDNLFDYEYNSEDEWEQDEEGEELVSEDDLDDPEDLESDLISEDENNWLVPHGYLSDDEGLGENDELKQSNNNPGEKKDHIQKKIIKLDPIIIGIDNNNDSCKSFQGIWLIDDYQGGGIDITKCFQIIKSKTPKPKKPEFTNNDIILIENLMEGTIKSIPKLIEEIKLQLPLFSKREIEIKIKSIGIKEKRNGKLCWYLRKNDINEIIHDKSSPTINNNNNILNYFDNNNHNNNSSKNNSPCKSV